MCTLRGGTPKGFNSSEIGVREGLCEYMYIICSHGRNEGNIGRAI